MCVYKVCKSWFSPSVWVLGINLGFWLDGKHPYLLNHLASHRKIFFLQFYLKQLNLIFDINFSDIRHCYFLFMVYIFQLLHQLCDSVITTVIISLFNFSKNWDFKINTHKYNLHKFCYIILRFIFLNEYHICFSK